MKYLFAALLSLFIASGTAIAGGNHSHDGGHSHDHAHGPIDGDKAIAKAEKKLLNLIEKNKIDASWRDIKASKVEQKTFTKGPEWVVSFVNPRATEADKQTLYIFYSLDGHYIAANFTGQ
ncbi:MAG: DUF6488 family protein [Gammaproteobacteria bacterium]|nr:DUF6488 family protein [Gammaproteobacteria bacterium]